LGHDVFTGLLAGAGVKILGPDDVAEAGWRTATVLVDAAPDHWQEAEAKSAPVVLVVTDQSCEADVVDALLRGAEAVLQADSDPELFLRAVDVVSRGGSVLGPAEARAFLRVARERSSTPAVKLTRREVEIVASIARGEAVKQTALALGISAKTVENLQGRLFRKLGARNRAQAVTQAYRLGVLVES